MDVKPTLDQINLVVRDLEKSLAFYRVLGLDFGKPTGLHATMTFPSGVRLTMRLLCRGAVCSGVRRSEMTTYRWRCRAGRSHAQPA